MNRFRTKKRVKEEAAAPRPSQESESSGPFRMFGKNKKSQEEPKKEIDLAAALPSSDDFRTSLLMTGLSARFSMLREQDDPNTKIGKASDDSVLFPKRQSRLLEFGLSDIAEVESIRAPPPFARMDSVYSSDGESMSGSIMNRAKPTDGNNLFGGRQKIYKIPVSGAASSKNLASGGMGGRALYEDDVSLSAFQKWRQTEKDRQSYEHQRNKLSAELNLELPRAESPPNYNRKRETNSTTSSTPSVSRYSTAATSFSSQPTSSIKDWQSATTAPSSAAGTPVLERSVTRTRRLYETGLTNDLHEQQSSALSRIDNLSRQRNFGTRTPDSLQNSASPTGGLFTDRFGDRKPMTTKVSTPNLRSISPPTTGSSVATMDLGIKVPSASEQKSTFGGGAPPLSPPISETEENPMLPIQPNDRGKATALGVFQKPAQAYDESKYAQRQLQLQQGRETPTNRFRTESNASYETARSRSSSSVYRLPYEKPELAVQTEPTVKEEVARIDAVDKLEDGVFRLAPLRPVAADSPLKRPSDHEHPAFRDTSLPTPLSLNAGSSTEPSPVSEKPDLSVSSSRQPSPEDSPTLGPTSGLSGMVRQHLRTDSNTSSVYGAAPNTSGLTSRFPTDPYESNRFEDLAVASNPWRANTADWSTPYYGNESLNKKDSPIDGVSHRSVHRTTREPTNSTSVSSIEVEEEKEKDEFASQLADGARRVRERLTSYVGTESRDSSPHPADASREVSLGEPQPTRPNPLGILRSKTSRGSLVERNREPAAQVAKAKKLLGLGASTMSTSPSPSRPSFEEKSPLSPMQEQEEEPSPVSKPALQPEEDKEDKDDENLHAGLRAFRQARRELQRLKELEVQKRHLNNPSAAPSGPLPGPPAPRTTPNRERLGPQHRTPSRERKPPPVYYRPRAPSQESSEGNLGNGSRPASRTERERSGSETSNGGRSNSRPARLRTASSPYEDRQVGPNAPARPMMRSPGLPGTDIRRSPIMPPQPYPGATSSPNYFDRSISSSNLGVQPRHRGYDSGQPSPISPLNGMPSPFLNSENSNSAVLPSPRRPSAPPLPNFDTSATGGRIDERMRRTVRKQDISEPTFVSSTSRVPTVSLPHVEDLSTRSGGKPRSRSGSLLGAASSTPNLLANHAPPLPPINPKRRNVLGNLRGRGSEEDMTASTPHLPLPQNTGAVDHANDTRSVFSFSDEEDGKVPRERRKLRKASSEANGLNNRARHTKHGSPPYAANSQATLVASGGGVPGGMI